MTEFYMIWIAGHGVPKKIYDSIESARIDAQRLRAEVTGREVYILAPMEVIEGRKLLDVEENRHPAKQQVEPGAPKPKRNRKKKAAIEPKPPAADPVITIKKTRKISL